MSDLATDWGDLAQVAENVAAPAHRLFAALDRLSGSLTQVMLGVRGEGRRPARADLAGLRAVAEELLAADRLVLGAGVVLEPGLLADADRYLEWRQRAAGGRYRALVLDVDPASDDPYDYPEMEWYRVPRDERRRMVTGPYYDYRGAEHFELTFAVPVIVGGEFVGVAGADVPLSALEAELLPVLRRVPLRAALVNHEDRVVTANTPHYATRERARPVAADLPARVVPVIDDLGWSLLVTPGQ